MATATVALQPELNLTKTTGFTAECVTPEVTDKEKMCIRDSSSTTCYKQKHSITPKSYIAPLMDSINCITLPVHYCETSVSYTHLFKC